MKGPVEVSPTANLLTTCTVQHPALSPVFLCPRAASIPHSLSPVFALGTHLSWNKNSVHVPPLFLLLSLPRVLHFFIISLVFSILFSTTSSHRDTLMPPPLIRGHTGEVGILWCSRAPTLLDMMLSSVWSAVPLTCKLCPSHRRAPLDHAEGSPDGWRGAWRPPRFLGASPALATAALMLGGRLLRQAASKQRGGEGGSPRGWNCSAPRVRVLRRVFFSSGFDYLCPLPHVGDLNKSLFIYLFLSREGVEQL